MFLGLPGADPISESKNNASADDQKYQFEIQLLDDADTLNRLSTPCLCDLTQIIDQTVIPRSKFKSALTKYKWCICFVDGQRDTVKVQSDAHLKQLLLDSKSQQYRIRILFDYQHKYDEWRKTKEGRILPVMDQLEVTVDQWIDTKITISSLQSHQFRRDVGLFNQLKAFRFEGTVLYIDIQSISSLHNEDEQKMPDDQSPDDYVLSMNSEDFMSFLDRLLLHSLSRQTNAIATRHRDEIADDDAAKKAFRREHVVEGFPITDDPDSDEDIHDDHKVDINDEIDSDLDDGKESIEDHTIMERTNPYLHGIHKVFDKESNTIIDENDIENIVQILCDAKLDLDGNTQNVSKFDKNGLELFEGNKTKTDLIASELQMLIQLQVMKTQIEDIIPKFEIAKKIQKERIRYHDQGGSDCLENHKTLAIFKEEEGLYQMVLSRWRFYHYSWKLMISDLRKHYHLLSYYTVNDMRFICDHFNEWLMDREESHIQKLTAKFAFIDREWNDENTREMISRWDTLDDRVIATELNTFLKRNVCENRDEIPLFEGLLDSINTYLELHAFAQYDRDSSSDMTSMHNLLRDICMIFNTMNSSFTMERTKALLTSWREPVEPFDERLIFKKLGKYLMEQFDRNKVQSTDAMSVHTIQSLGITNQVSHSVDTPLLLSGKPHLYYVHEVDLVLESVIKLFYEFNQEPCASQIMFCSAKTTIQDITCFLSRCSHHELCCLVQPERLQSHITEEILPGFMETFCDAEAKLAIICADKTSRWFSDYSIYQSELGVLSDEESKKFYEKYIIGFDSDDRRTSCNPICVVFLSDTECAGKTYQIQDTCCKFGLECIQIPFNSPTVDRDFVVDRLCDGEAIWLKKKQHKKLKNKKIAFHLNISSHAGKDVNELLFQLLILRHITKSNGESFVVRAHHVFFIELPSQISNTFKKTNIDDVKKHFYFCAGPKSYIHKDEIKMELDNFYISDEHQFVLKYLDALDQTLNGDNELLQIQKRGIDWNHKTHPNVGIDGMIELVTTFTGKQRNEFDFVFLKSYLDILYQQFIQLATSPLLIKNADAVDIVGMFQRSRYIQYHRVIAASIAKNGCYFASNTAHPSPPRNLFKARLFCDHLPFDVNAQNWNTVQSLLNNLTFEILALWIVARPINSKLDHWAVKMLAPPCLITIDFLEHDKKYCFGFHHTAATDSALGNFFNHQIREKKTRKSGEWKIITAVTPLLDNSIYGDDILQILKAFMDKEQPNKINVHRKACDVAEFIKRCTTNQRSASSYNTYTPMTPNYHFAADLFEFLVGHRPEYREKVKRIRRIAAGMEEASGLGVVAEPEFFSLVAHCQNADPPIVFMNSGFMAELQEAKLEDDWTFYSKHAENTFTVLCDDLKQCQHDDAKEWKELHKVMMGGIGINTDLVELKEQEAAIRANQNVREIRLESDESQKEKLRLLLRLCGGYRRYDDKEKRFKPVISERARSDFVDSLWRANAAYILTFDNILKMVSIFYRIKARIPVLIMGETGCGKTRLLQYMANALSMRMIAVHVHCGFVMENLKKVMKIAIDDATIEYKGRTVLLFFDVINTSEEISSFKEIICDHSFRGNSLPPNLIIIGALNAYHRKRSTSDNEIDCLPLSMERFVWNFGYLKRQDERQYIAGIVNQEWDRILMSLGEILSTNPYKPVFAKLIDISQSNLRKWSKDGSVCSLRDVRRANFYFRWFYKHSRDQGQVSRVIQCMVLALAQCYYYRLSFDCRWKYEQFITRTLWVVSNSHNVTPPRAGVKFAANFKKVLEMAQDQYLEMLEYPDGIAMNRALKENIFVILLGILTKTPTILMGPTGSSKTLAMEILQSNLNPVSKNKKLSDWGIPDHSFHSVQLSKMTTLDMIRKEWESAERAQKFDKKAPKSVFILDKMGLAEQSEKKPLKVLHNLLEDSKIAFIGFSNQRLNSIKMNQCVLHEVVPIDQDRDDLKRTATALADKGPGGNSVMALNNKLGKLVEFYFQLRTQQKHSKSPFSGTFHFYGARDFYNTIAYLKFCCNALGRSADDELVLEAICRNFGGLNQQQFAKYMKNLILPILNLNDWTSSMKHMTSINLIRSNIVQSQSDVNHPQSYNYEMRHVMLITDTEVSWKYLYDMDVLKHSKSRVIFESKFKNDQNSSLHSHQQLESIKNAMVSGHTVVLLHLNELYDSLYDVLNQRYLKVGTKRFSKIFIRDQTMTVQIHRSFRFVIVIPTTNAYHLSANPNDYTPVAFLNRLEKQYLSIDALYGNRKNWVQKFQSLQYRLELDLFGEDKDWTQVFAGYIPRLTFASVLIYAEFMLFGSIKSNQSNPLQDENNQIVQLAVALLLSNCYLRYFIGHQTLELHHALSPLKRDKCFSSVRDVVEYFENPKNGNLYHRSPDHGDIELIRVTTHDHLQHFSDFTKHFHMKRQGKGLKDEKCNGKERRKRNVELVNISDIVSSNAFVQAISEFLKDPTFPTLIVQTSNKNNDEFLQNLHIQYLIEQSKHAAKADPNKRAPIRKQIVIVIYMNRLSVDTMERMDSDAKKAQFIQSQQYPLIFNREWKHVYCDTVLPAEIKITDLNVNDPYFAETFNARIHQLTASAIRRRFPTASHRIHFPASMRHELVRVANMFKHDTRFSTAIVTKIEEVLLSDTSGNSLFHAMWTLLDKYSKNDNCRIDEHLDLKGSYHSMLIDQIGRQIEDELVNVLSSILNHHSSSLYRGHTKVTQLSISEIAEIPQLRQFQTEVDRTRIELSSDEDMKRIWITLMTGFIDLDYRIHDKLQLKVMFPFSPYIYSYFQNARRDMIDAVKKTANDYQGIEGQRAMISKIRRFLEMMEMDECIFAVDRHIEWYVYDVAALECQERFGKPNSMDYTRFLIRFIQRFILCAIHQTHEIAVDDSAKAAFRREHVLKGFPITDDPDSDEDTDDEEAAFYEEEESEEELGDAMGFNESKSYSDDDYEDDENWNNGNEDACYDDVVDCDDTTESIEDQTILERTNPYPYGIHEVHASLWCNESLLQHLIAIMKVFGSHPEGLQEIVAICWEDTRRGLSECVFQIMQQVVHYIKDRFRRSETFLFELFISKVVQSSSSISWVLQWLRKKQFDANRMLSLHSTWDLIRLYLLCYERFEGFTERRLIKRIKDGLQRLLDEFRNEEHIQFDDSEKLQCVHELITDIGRNIEMKDEDRSQYVIQQYICHFAFRTFEENGTMLNEEFVLYLMGLMSRQPEEDLDDEAKQYPEFYANNYTKQQIATKMLKYLSTRKQEQSVLQRLDQELSRSPLLCSVLLRAAESEHHLKWLKNRAKHQIPTMKAINHATKALKDSEQQSVLHQLLAVAECKVLIHYAVKMNITAIGDAFATISKMYVNKSSSSERFQSLSRGLGFYFFAEFWRQKSSVEACRLRKLQKFAKKNFLKHVFHPTDLPNESDDTDEFMQYWAKRIENIFDDQNANDIDFKRAFEAKYLPHLFLPFRLMTITNFRTCVTSNADQEHHPVTCGLLNALNDVGLSVFATRYIPSMISWMKNVHQRLSGRISRKDLDEKDPETGEWKYSAKWLLDTLEDEGVGDRKELEKELIGFVIGWNYVAKRVTFDKLVDGDDEKTISIPVISSNPQGEILPINVPLKLCIFAPDSQTNSSTMIKGILIHLVTTNQNILDRCKMKSDIIRDDEELFCDTKANTIALSDVSDESDVVDVDDVELLTIVQECSQQSLEYKVTSKFEIKLSLLEKRLYERYIMGRKAISLDIDDLEFQFAGYRDIQSCVNRINHKYAEIQGVTSKSANTKYFVEWSQHFKDLVLSRLHLLFARMPRSQRSKQWELQYMKATKRGIEQILIALSKWKMLPPRRNTKMSTIMREDLKLQKSEYQFFEQGQIQSLLRVEHCECVWKLFNRLCILKEGKWTQIPQNVHVFLRRPITSESLKNKVRQWVNLRDIDEMIQILIEWRDFAAERLTNSQYKMQSLKENVELSVYFKMLQDCHVPHPDGTYSVKFHKRPFGMHIGKTHPDASNLYVKRIDPDSEAERGGVRPDSVLIKIQDEVVENLGADVINKIFDCFGTTLPLTLTFRPGTPTEVSLDKNIALKHFVSAYAIAVDELKNHNELVAIQMWQHRNDLVPLSMKDLGFKTKRRESRSVKLENEHHAECFEEYSDDLETYYHDEDFDDQQRRGMTNGSTVESFDHEQLHQWIQQQFDHRPQAIKHGMHIWSTKYERDIVFPSILRVIQSSNLSGNDIVLFNPSSYVTDVLMPIYRKMNAAADGHNPICNLNKDDFESVMWRLRQCAFTDVNHPVGALIDNPYCIYIWVYFLKKPSYHYAIEQGEDTSFMPLQRCLDSSEVHLYYAEYFPRTDPLRCNLQFHLCEKSNQMGTFKRLWTDGECVEFRSLRRNHVMLQVYNDGHKSSLQRPRKDVVRKVIDKQDGMGLVASDDCKMTTKSTNSPYFECLLQFCFTNIGRRIALSASIDAIEGMILMKKGNGKKNDALQMISEKLNAEKQWISSFNEHNQTWSHLIKFLFYFYWILAIDHSHQELLFGRFTVAIDVLQHLLSGKYGPPKRVIYLLRSIINPVAESFIGDIARTIDRTKEDVLRRYQYLLWYNLIDSICFSGSYSKQPKLPREVDHFKFESEFIRMIQIDVNIYLLTNVEREEPLEKVGFEYLRFALQQSKGQKNKDDLRNEIYDQMCRILLVFQSNKYLEAAVQYKDDIMFILRGQQRPLEASIALYRMLQPIENKDIDLLIDFIADLVLDLDPSKHKKAVYKLVELMGSNRKIAQQHSLIRAILRNPRIRWKEELIPYLVPTLKMDQFQGVRAEIFDEFWLKYDLLLVVKVLVGAHGLPIETFNEMIKAHPERICKEHFDDWLEVIVDKNVKQIVKREIAKHPPITYKKCATNNAADSDQILNAMEEKLFTAPHDGQSHEPLMSHDMALVCDAMMESFLAVDTRYLNCHDVDIGSIEMINYFYSGYGMHCVEYCHRFLQHPNGSNLKHCNQLVGNFIKWWKEVKRLFADALLEKTIIDHLIGPLNIYENIDRMYLKVGGQFDGNVDGSISGNVENYKTYFNALVTVTVTLDIFYANFVPKDNSLWHESLSRMYELMCTIKEDTSVHIVMTINWSQFAAYRIFLEELQTLSDSMSFRTIWNESLDHLKERWSNANGIQFENLDVVDMCLWLESRKWNPDQWKIIFKLQRVFIAENVTGTILNEANKQGSNKATYFAAKLNTESYFDDDQDPLREVLGLLFLDLKQKVTFKWNRQYSMSILMLIYVSRIKPAWDRLRGQLKSGECRVYDVQKHFQLTPWQIDENAIKQEIGKMITNANIGNAYFIQNQTTKRIVDCWQCIESLSSVRIIMDGISLFQNVLNASKRFNGLKIDSKYQSLRKTLDAVQEFDFYQRYAPSVEDAQSIDLGEIELLCLNPGCNMTMMDLLNFWDHHHDTLGAMKCNHEGLKWLFTLCSHDIFVNELFTMFEDDVHYVQFRSLYQNPSPQETEQLIRLNAVRSQLIMGTASTLSGKSMSEATDLLLNSILMGISSSDLSKLKALIEQWDAIKPQPENPLIEEEKKEDDQGNDVLIQNNININGDGDDEDAVALWLREKVGLPQYFELFQSEGFDELEMLMDLTDPLLKQIGIKKMGHRMKIMKEIRKLNCGPQEEQNDNNGTDDGGAAAEANEGVPAFAIGANVMDTLSQQDVANL